MADRSRLEVMNFLNEATARYPEAISFAAGRPANQTFDMLSPDYLRKLIDAFQGVRRTIVKEHSLAELFQYGNTSGSINDAVCRQLRSDDGVHCGADDVVITSGCQEAIALCIAELCPNENDVLLTCNPCYIGASGAAECFGVRSAALSEGSVELSEAILEACDRLSATNRRARALYLVPDFDNPTGRVIDETQRRSIIQVCSSRGVVVLEDNPYGLFRYRGASVSTMYNLDEEGCVIYLSTYSKTICPALRVGSMVFPSTLFGNRDGIVSLKKRLIQRKSFLTVNTGQISQAIVGGLLIEQEFSLKNWIQPALNTYRSNLLELKRCLSVRFGDGKHGVSWNDPTGGFFLVVNLPFRFDSAEVEVCAKDYGIILMPMSYFSCDDSHDTSLRLSFSGVQHGDIYEGMKRFCSYIEARTTSGDLRSSNKIQMEEDLC